MFLANPGVGLKGEKGGEEGKKQRKRQRGRVLREFLRLVEDGMFE